MVAYDRIAATVKIDSLYLLDGINVHTQSETCFLGPSRVHTPSRAEL